MSQIEVPYEEAKQQIIDEIQKNAKGYLATSEGDLVTVRRMGLISSGLTIWCITTDNSRKVKQIIANPNVAIAAGDFLQIARARATILNNERYHLRTKNCEDSEFTKSQYTYLVQIYLELCDFSWQAIVLFP